ncbi:NAD(P)H-hydrate dehydratase [Roseivivax sp.]
MRQESGPGGAVLSAEEMRGAEAAWIASGHGSGGELMERAGQGAVAAVFAERPDLARAPHAALVLAGPGNNGGDGFVMARRLAHEGWDVRVLAMAAPEAMPPDARAAALAWQEMGGAVEPLTPGSVAAQRGAPCHLVIDAVFGIGLNRPVAGDLSEALGLSALPGAFRVAVDLPSGFCAESGRLLGPEGAAHDLPVDLTVTFHRPKRGHLLAPLASRQGALRVVDIGLEARAGVAGAAPRSADSALEREGGEQPKRARGGDGHAGGADSKPSHPGAVRAVSAPDRSVLKLAGHKYDHGHALVLSGGFGKSGAARLAARAALRVGAGLVSLGAPGNAQAEIAAQITALMLRRIDGAPDLAEALADPRLSALCLGPGLGLSRAEELVPEALASRRAVVLDADALTAFEEAPDRLFEALHDGAVLTPHGGEFARLFPDLAARLSGEAPRGPAFSKIEAAQMAAARSGAVVLLKGPDTVVAAPDGTARVIASFGARAVPWLATAGAGDVLSGLILGLLARGLAPLEAGAQGAALHVACARAAGPGMIAEDLAEKLPEVLAAVE